MVNLDAIPMRRSFLPPFVVLNSNSGRKTADFATIADGGLPHAEVVADLRDRSLALRPSVVLGADGASTLLPKTESKGEAKTLCELGYALDRRRDLLVRVHEPSALAGDLNAMVGLGYGLDRGAWAVVGPDRRALGWSLEVLAEDGAWARRALAGEEDSLALRRELRAAIQTARFRSVHLTPLLDGSLRARMQPFENDSSVRAWEAHEGGCGMLAIRPSLDRLSVYMTSDGWLAWFLQRALLEAWAEESFGENAPWHWGV